MRHLTVWGYDIGGTTKVLRFYGNKRGKMWYADSFPKNIPEIPTPHDIPANHFMSELTETLRKHGFWGAYNELRGFSICGPTVRGHCLRLINRGIHGLFPIVGGSAALNDGMAATIGSLLAGVAKNHEGALALFTLGTGVGFGAFHWDEHSNRVPNNGEIHFPVRGSRRRCNCSRVGCFEASANESALRYYITCNGVTISSQDMGREIQRIRDGSSVQLKEKVMQALETWFAFIAKGIANVYVLLNMGGNGLQPPAMFILAGGLSTLVDTNTLHKLILDEFEGDPLVGSNFIVRKEGKLGNRAGALGAAAMALANHLKKDVTEITFLDEPPT